MTRRESWDEFRKAGMLWWVNMLLHTFGWAITVQVNSETKAIEDVYPSRVKFRGFDEKSNTEGYIKVSQYMKDNAEELLKESKE
jgi:hypothetical protein